MTAERILRELSQVPCETSAWGRCGRDGSGPEHWCFPCKARDFLYYNSTCRVYGCTNVARYIVMEPLAHVRDMRIRADRQSSLEVPLYAGHPIYCGIHDITENNGKGERR